MRLHKTKHKVSVAKFFRVWRQYRVRNLTEYVEVVNRKTGATNKETRRSRLIVRVLLTFAWILLTEAHVMLCNSGS